MKWSAAGRPTADGPDRRTTRRAARPAVLLTGLFLAAGTGLAPRAAAAPAAAPSGDGGPAGRPVQIEVTRFEPRTLTPSSVITVNGSLTNTGNATVDHLALRLQRGEPLTTRAGLVAADRDPDPDTAVVPPFQPIRRQLEPGDSLTFSYQVPASALQLGATGVYPVLLNVNGTVQGTEQRVGELDSYLVEPPGPTAARTTVAWLWPLVDQPHRDASGRFTDDRLAREITANGRLDRALAVLERLPRVVAPGASTPTLTVPVTLAIDPALVEALEIMAAGPYQVPGGQGSGTQAAQKFLSRLKALAPLLPVVALPYGDVDADALQTAGRADVVVRSLPGTPAGTAHDDRLIRADGGATPSATASSSAPPTAPSDGRSAGERILSSALGVRPRTDLAWLPSSPVHPATLQTLHANGVDQVLLPAAALSAGDAALGIGRATALARTTVPTPAGSLTALVADTRLGRLADDGQTAGGPRMAVQRYLAELTLVSSQAAGGTAAQPTVLVSPPREVDADPAAVAAMMTATTNLPWLEAGSVQAVGGGRPGPAGRLAAPPATPSLDPAGMADVAAAVAVRDALAGAAVGDAGTALAPYDAAASRASSLEWRGERTGFRASARELHATLTRLSDRVTLVAPADGTYSLASNDAPLVLTVRNDLPFAVRVLLRLSTPESGLVFGDIGRQTLAPGQRTTLKVPTQLHRSGGFAVTASLTTPGGQALGDPVQIHVKSTAYGPIGLFITIGAAALLGLLFVRRLVRFVLRRRHGSGGRDDGLPGPSAEGAAVPLPPTRSPV